MAGNRAAHADPKTDRPEINTPPSLSRLIPRSEKKIPLTSMPASPPPPATGAPIPGLAATGLDEGLLLHLIPGDRRPGGTRGRPGDPAGGAKGGGWVDGGPRLHRIRSRGHRRSIPLRPFVILTLAPLHAVASERGDDVAGGRHGGDIYVRG